MSTKPVIGITMGDAAGIGPEVIVKALAHIQELADLCQVVVIGDHARLSPAARICGLPFDLPTADSPLDALGGGGPSVLDVPGLPPDLPFGHLSSAAGDAAYRYIAKAAELAL